MNLCSSNVPNHQRRSSPVGAAGSLGGVILDRFLVLVLSDQLAGFGVEPDPLQLHVAVAGEVLEVDDLDAAVGRSGQAGYRRIDAGVQDGDDDAAAVALRVRGPERVHAAGGEGKLRPARLVFGRRILAESQTGGQGENHGERGVFRHFDGLQVHHSAGWAHVAKCNGARHDVKLLSANRRFTPPATRATAGRRACA